MGDNKVVPIGPRGGPGGNSTRPTGVGVNKNRRRIDKRLMDAREDEAVRLYASFYSYGQIAQALDTTDATAYRLVKRGLERNAERTVEMAPVARGLLATRYEALLATWYPLAVGDPPSLPAADYVLKVLDRWAKIHGVDAAPPVNVTLNVVVPADVMRRDVLASLDAVEERTKMIEGVLVRDNQPDDEPDRRPQ